MVEEPLPATNEAVLQDSSALPSPSPSERNLRPTPTTVLLVAIGGSLGAAAREVVEQAMPASHNGFPGATLAINLSGAFLLGLVLEAMARIGEHTGGRKRARLIIGTGFLGAYTTYSTFALEADLLVRAGHQLSAVGYVLLTAVGGLVAAAAGVAVSAGRRLPPTRQLPMDPDVDSEPT